MMNVITNMAQGQRRLHWQKEYNSLVRMVVILFGDGHQCIPDEGNGRDACIRGTGTCT
jgi:hypothetical protein